MGLRVKQPQTRVCTAALCLVDLKLQQLTKLEVIETKWRMQDYRFTFYEFLFQKTASLKDLMKIMWVIWDTFVRSLPLALEKNKLQ